MVPNGTTHKEAKCRVQQQVESQRKGGSLGHGGQGPCVNSKDCTVGAAAGSVWSDSTESSRRPVYSAMRHGSSEPKGPKDRRPRSTDTVTNTLADVGTSERPSERVRLAASLKCWWPFF